MRGLSSGRSHAVRRWPQVRLQIELSRRWGARLSRADQHAPSLGTPSLAEGQMRELRQVLSIQIELFVQGNCRRHVQLVQLRLSQQGVVLQRRSNRRELRDGLVLHNRRSTLVDRQITWYIIFFIY